MSLSNNFYEKAINYDNLPPNQGIRFDFGQVSYHDFSQKYQSQGWFQRKVVALPLALWSLVVKTIYHLSKAILIGVIKSIFDKGLYLKTHFFHIARDLQESFGRITSLFHDKYGLYHIQNSEFHHNYYDLKLTIKSDFYRINRIQDALIFFDKEDFSRQINNIDYDKLTEIEFIRFFPDGKKFDVLSDVNFRKIVKFIEDPLYFPQIPIKHINNIDYDKLTENQFSQLFPVGDANLKEKFKILSVKNFQNIVKFIKHIKYFSIIPEHLINHLDYQSISKQQLLELFWTFRFETRTKLSRLSAENFNRVISKWNFNDDIFSCIPATQLMHINYDKLTKSQVDKLFPSWSSSAQQNFANLSAAQVLQIFDKLDDSQLSFITISQLSSPLLLNKYLNRRLQQKQQEEPQQYSYHNSNRPRNDQNSYQSFNDFFKEFFAQSSAYSRARDREEKQKAENAAQIAADYKLLGIPETATEDEIRQAFRKLAFQYHPDRIKQQTNETNEDFKVRADKADADIKELGNARDRLIAELKKRNERESAKR